MLLTYIGVLRKTSKKGHKGAPQTELRWGHFIRRSLLIEKLSLVYLTHFWARSASAYSQVSRPRHSIRSGPFDWTTHLCLGDLVINLKLIAQLINSNDVLTIVVLKDGGVRKDPGLLGVKALNLRSVINPVRLLWHRPVIQVSTTWIG